MIAKGGVTWRQPATCSFNKWRGAVFWHKWAAALDRWLVTQPLAGTSLALAGLWRFVMLCYNPVYASLQWPSLVCIFALCPTWQALAFVGLIGAFSSRPCGLWCLWSAVQSHSRDWEAGLGICIPKTYLSIPLTRLSTHPLPTTQILTVPIIH